MTMGSAVRRLLAYDEWANAAALASLMAADAPPSRAIEIMAHIVAAEWLWLGRLKHDKAAVAVWPDWTLAQSADNLRNLKSAWEAYLDVLRAEDLASPAGYTNTQGEHWTNTIQDILTHVVVHSAYHRGQIAYALGRAGHRAAYTDFIHAVRRGFIA